MYSTMPPKRKAEENSTYPTSKKPKISDGKEIRLPIDVICEIFSFLDYDEATVTSRVAVDWRSAYKIDVLHRFRQQYLKRLRFVHSIPKYKSQEQCDRDLKDLMKAIDDTKKELESMEQYASALTDLKLENSSLSICEKFWIWYTTPLARDEDCFVVHIQPEGEQDIWDLVPDADKYKTYDLDYFVDFLLNYFEVEVDDKGRASGDPAKIAVCEKYMQELMDKNFGSCVFDW